MLQGKKTPSRSVLMEFFSREYGWTPEEIKKQSYYDLMEYLNICGMRSMLQNKKNGR